MGTSSPALRGVICSTSSSSLIGGIVLGAALDLLRWVGGHPIAKESSASGDAAREGVIDSHRSHLSSRSFVLANACCALGSDTQGRVLRCMKAGGFGSEVDVPLRGVDSA